MGTVITMPLAGVLAEYIGWDAIFYVFGKVQIMDKKLARGIVVILT